MRTLFNILANLDWISPLFGLAQDITHLQAYSIIIPWHEAEAAGWSIIQIEQMFIVNGIEYWGGVMMPNWEYIIKVSPEQAEQAEYVLSQHGVPFN